MTVSPATDFAPIAISATRMFASTSATLATHRRSGKPIYCIGRNAMLGCDELLQNGFGSRLPVNLYGRQQRKEGAITPLQAPRRWTRPAFPCAGDAHLAGRADHGALVPQGPATPAGRYRGDQLRQTA